MASGFDSIMIILCNPDEPGNIGSVCRAMKTMGFHNLRITGGKTYDESMVKIMSVHAFDVWENARHYATLEEAVNDVNLTIGVTRRRGKKRKPFSFLPEELGNALSADGRSALVFGNEEHGLTDWELSLCDAACEIPSSPECPSLNLSHSVQVITYAVRRSGLNRPAYTPMDRKQINRLVESMADNLEEIGFYKIGGRKEAEDRLRSVFSRAYLSNSEGRWLEKLFTKMKNLAACGGKIGKPEE
jgi:TrmH family RNA methyltransferase